MNTDSGHDNLTSYYKPEWLSTYNVNQESLFPVLTECRVTKLNEEIEIMRRVCEETANAHREVMRHCKPGIYEYELAGVF